MIDPIQPYELSALLDGELPAQRAAEVREALRIDPVLQAEFAQLTVLDRRWLELAAQASFSPNITLATKARPWPHWSVVTVFVAGLVGVRFLTKLDFNLAFQFVVHVLVLSVIAVGIILLNRRYQENNICR